MERRGVTPDTARAVLRTNSTAIGAIAVHRKDADSLICGTFGQYLWHLKYVREVLARGVANRYRIDLDRAELAGGRCGFRIGVPEGPLGLFRARDGAWLAGV